MARLRLRSTPPGSGVVISMNAAASLGFTAVWTLECPFLEGDRLDPHPHLAQLDARGIVRVGTQVRTGMMLVGRSRPAVDDPERRRNGSLVCPWNVAGAVVAIDETSDGTIRVTIEQPRGLQRGTLLRAGTSEALVIDLVPRLDGCDALWPGLDGEHEVERLTDAIDRLQVRAGGSVGEISHQPQASAEAPAGSRVHREHLRALFERGAFAFAHELITARSDDEAAREALESAIADDEPPDDEPSRPRVRTLIERGLLALGFRADFDAPPTRLERLDDAAIRKLAPGVVESPETLDGPPHWRPRPGGLLAEAIFGGPTSPRDARFGRIELATPLLHPWAVGPVAELLHLPRADLVAVLDGELDLQGRPPARLEDTGAFAVRAALAALKRPEHPEGWVFETWPVLPPGLRPMVPLDADRVATSDLNDLYAMLISTSWKLRRLGELKAPLHAQLGAMGELRLAFERLIDNAACAAPRNFEGRLMVSLADTLQPWLRALRLGKRTDPSATGIVVPVDGLSATVLRAPAFAFDMLIGERPEPPETFPAVVLTTAPFQAAAFIAEPWDEDCFGLAPAALAALHLAPGAELSMHLPGSQDAVTEVTRMIHATTVVPRTGAGAWVLRAIESDPLGATLFAAMRAGAGDPLEDDETRSLLGLRCR